MSERRPSRPPAWRILVAGGGAPSLAFALAVARAVPGAVELRILDPRFRSRSLDSRAFALSPAAVEMLTLLGVWPDIRSAAEQIRAMAITDGQVADPLRPTYLTFEADPDEPLGHLIEAQALSDGLIRACFAHGVVLDAVGVASGTPETGGMRVATTDGLSARAALLVAADGARSRLREEAGIGWVGRSYRQLGLVATVSHGEPHRGRAVQHFLPGGPFAILPLPGPGLAHPHRSSIVWTEEERAARVVLEAGPSAQAEAVAQRFGPDLGAVALDTPLVAHPLAVGLARSYVAERLALLGDAAHVVHPLAGQGLNLGLADAASLAEHVVEAVRLGLDPGGREVLAGYERDRRAAAVTLAGITDGLNRLFSNDRLPARVLRDLGLGLVDRLRPAKAAFAAAAAGRGPGEPRLMRGLPI